MKCPYCGSLEIVWDNRTGAVVCTRCGSVLDNIYDYDASNFMHSDLSELMPSYSAAIARRRKDKLHKISQPRQSMYCYAEIETSEKLKQHGYEHRININIEELLRNEAVYIAFDKLSRLNMPSSQLERAIIAYYLVFGYNDTLKKLGGNIFSRLFLDKILKKIDKKLLLSIKVYVDKVTEGMTTTTL